MKIGFTIASGMTLYPNTFNDRMYTQLHQKTGMIFHVPAKYRAEKKGWYVVARYFFLPLLSFSAWPCLAVA